MFSVFARLNIEAETSRLILDRPQKRNALTRQFLIELQQALSTVENDETVRVLLLEAEGPVFCAGMDLGEMQLRAAQPNAAEEWRHDTAVYRDVVDRLFRLSLPTVAVVQGPVLAGGLGLVLACDIVLAAESASFSLPEPKRGITAAVVTPLLNYRLGPGHAGYLLLSGGTMSSADASRAGLCHEVAPDSELEAHRTRLIASILTGAPAALAISKRTLQECAAGLLNSQLDAAMTISAEARETADAREGLAAFLERREPGWSRESGTRR
ncbi:MAG: enoyl-CoA hydratase/isomerase family protein [Planctomycetaceae bacterium]